MTKHEQLKYLCDKIWFLYRDIGIDWNWYSKYFWKPINTWGVIDDRLEKIDVREVIFTQEFMDKYREYKKSSYGYSDSWENILLRNLDNPVEYLYNNLTNKYGNKFLW